MLIDLDGKDQVEDDVSVSEQSSLDVMRRDVGIIALEGATEGATAHNYYQPVPCSKQTMGKCICATATAAM